MPAGFFGEMQGEMLNFLTQYGLPGMVFHPAFHDVHWVSPRRRRSCIFTMGYSSDVNMNEQNEAAMKQGVVRSACVIAIVSGDPLHPPPAASRASLN